MKIDIFYHDKFKFSFEKDLSAIYLDRLKSIPKSIISSINCKKINTKELTKIITDSHKKSFLIFLDEKGENLSSTNLSELIFTKIDKNLIFFIGSTDGFNDEILEYAQTFDWKNVIQNTYLPNVNKVLNKLVSPDFRVG